MDVLNKLGHRGFLLALVTLTWALVELARDPDKQGRLRKELSVFGDEEPSYDQLTNELPYLDAFFRETLRLHSPVHQNLRLVGFGFPSLYVSLDALDGPRRRYPTKRAYHYCLWRSGRRNHSRNRCSTYDSDSRN